MQGPVGYHLSDFAKLYEQETKRVVDDTYVLLRSYPSLLPKEDIYYNNEGIPETLMCLTGTVPINFKGTKYNIPIMMWVPKRYPHCSPMCFVTPTKEMVIKQNHKYVDPNGQCTVSRIEFWNASTTLLELVTELCAVFSKEPPLFAKPAQPPTSHASFRNSKPLPPTPSSTHSPFPSPSPSHHISPPPSIHHTSPPPSHSSSSLFSPFSSTSSLPSPSSHSVKPHPLTQSTLYQQGELLRKATQKMQKGLEEFFKVSTQDMDMFIQNQSNLESRNNDIDQRIKAGLQDEIALEHSSAALIAKSEEIEEWIKQMGQPREIDELITPGDPISNQLFNVIAEDHACDDVLYYLGKALGSGKMDFDTYLKEVRSLSRQQFFARALGMKLSAMVDKRV